jgi:hypothetical protein
MDLTLRLAACPGVLRLHTVTQVRIDRSRTVCCYLVVLYMAYRRVATRIPVGDLLHGEFTDIPPQYNRDCCGVLFDEDLKTRSSLVRTTSWIKRTTATLIRDWTCHSVRRLC